MRSVTAVLAFLFVAQAAVAQECPLYTKNRDSLAAFPLVSQNLLPDGFVLYRAGNKRGLYRTETKSYAPTIVPGTANDVPFNITISDDGRWVLFVDSVSESMVLQKIAGGGRATMFMWDLKTCGFYRQSPMGSEVYYLEGSGRQARVIKALQVDLTGDSARILTNTSRSIVDFGYGGRYLENEWVNAGSAVVGDQVLVREDGFYSYYGRTGFLTIPDGGRGTAGSSDFHPWAGDPIDAVWGCGHTMSHDGMHCLQNSGLIGYACAAAGNAPLCQQWDGSTGGSACIPNRRAVLSAPWPVDTLHFDHKGFYVTKFWRPTDPVVTLDAIVDSFGTSINWAPPSYRRGQYTDVDFTAWNFSNDPRIVTGALKGGRLADLGLQNGLWVVNWVDNSWARITPDTLTLVVDDPALFITDTSGVRLPMRVPASLAAPTQPALRVIIGGKSSATRLSGSRWYTVDGRLSSGLVPRNAVLVVDPQLKARRLR